MKERKQERRKEGFLVVFQDRKIILNIFDPFLILYTLRKFYLY